MESLSNSLIGITTMFFQSLHLSRRLKELHFTHTDMYGRVKAGVNPFNIRNMGNCISRWKS